MSVMESLTLALVLIGWLVMFVGGIRLLVAAFRVSVGWGLAVLFISFAAFVFIFKYKPRARAL
ncbi:MAG: hypothetical protein ABR497_01785 [Kiritimatiellia bacterium]|nr:hypothetical protein [Lentisphaerota bacterium]